MATKNFDSLFEQLLNELTPPVTTELEPFAGSLKSKIGEAPGGGYLIGNIADALSKSKGEEVSKEQVIDMISQDLYNKVFPGGKNKANNEEAYRSSISKALLEIVKDIQDKENIKVPKAGAAVAGYTARIISQLGDAKKEYGAFVSKDEVKDAVENAEETVEGSKPSTEEETEEQPEESGNRTIVRIENMITDLVDDTGVLESDVLEDVHRKVLASDGLGLEERNIKGFIKSLASRLVDKQILERKGQYLKLGDNYEKYEASKSEGSEAITDEDLIKKYTGLGARKTSSREVWGGEE